MKKTPTLVTDLVRGQYITADLGNGGSASLTVDYVKPSTHIGRDGNPIQEVRGQGGLGLYLPSDILVDVVTP